MSMEPDPSPGRHPPRVPGPAAAAFLALTGLAIAAAGAAAQAEEGVAEAARAAAGVPPATHAAGAPPPEVTRLTVRAVARDAKVIGSNVGGARITVRDLATGEVLARGVQEGSTGSTPAIMEEPRARGRTAFGADPEAAAFVAELALERPTRVEVVAEGPLGTPHAEQRASKTLTLIPGHDVLGEGLILELHGFTVELLDREVVRDASAASGSSSGPYLRARARVTMLCGCPTEPGGMWDAEQIEVVGRLLREGSVLAERPLAFTGETSVYEARLPLPAEREGLELEVLAADAGRVNFGRAVEALDGHEIGDRDGRL